MKQEINLLKSLPQEPIQLPAKWITLITLSTLALLMLISLGMAITQVSSFLEVKKIHSENIKVTATFQQIAKEHPLLASDTPLPLRIIQLDKELQKKKEYFATLSRSLLRQGFSNYLSTLTTIAPKGLWLNEIAIDQEEKSIAFSGAMLKPVAMSCFLQSLQNSSVFANMQFNLFSMQNNGKPYTEFLLTNKPADLEKTKK
jgi:Tfp pilus assembly protein PilN